MFLALRLARKMKLEINKRYTYFIGDDLGDRCEIKLSSLEMDLGVIEAEDYNSIDKISIIVNRTTQFQGMLMRAFIG